MADDNTTASILIFLGCVLFAFGTVIIEYLEDCGLTWVQVFVINECLSLAYATIFGICYQLYMALLDEYERNELTINDLMAVFPPKEDIDKWKVLILHGIFFALAQECYIISLLYLSSGDCLLLRTMIPALIQIFLGLCFFKEKLTILLVISIILSVTGLILVVQPSFLFESNGDSLSSIGLLFVFLSSVAIILKRVILRYSYQNNYDIHWIALLYVQFIMGAAVSLINLIGVIIVYYSSGNTSDVNSNTDVWYNLSYLNYFAQSLVFIYSILLLTMKALFTFGFQIGDLSRISIVAGSDIPLTYILEYLLLSQIDNYITYVGVIICILSIITIFWENLKRSHETPQDPQIDNTDNNDNNSYSALIMDKDKDKHNDLEDLVDFMYKEIDSQDANVTSSSDSIHDTLTITDTSNTSYQSMVLSSDGVTN